MGRIILARFLERSPRSIDRLVARTDEEAVMLNACHASGAPTPVEIATLRGAHWEDQPDAAPRVLGRIDTAGGLPRPVYRSEAFVRDIVSTTAPSMPCWRGRAPSAGFLRSGCSAECAW